MNMKVLLKIIILATAFLIPGCEYGDIADVAIEKAEMAKSMFVAVGSNGRIWYSKDGKSWNDSGHTGATLNAVTYANGRFIAVGEVNAGANTIIGSTDGINWYSLTPPASHTARPLYSVTYGNGMYVAVGAWQSMNAAICVSKDGLSWEDRSEPLDNQYLYTIIYGNNSFFIAGNNTSRSSATAETGSWASSTLGTGTYKAGIFVNNTFFISGASGLLAYANMNPSTWTYATTSPYNTFNYDCIAYGNGRYIILGSAGNGITSIDGKTGWTPVTTNTTADILSVAYGKGIFVAVGATDSYNKNILWSFDGITWNNISAGSGIIFRGVTFRP